VSSSKFPRAVLALERFQAVVQWHVFFQRISCAALLVALTALIRFLAGVSSHVHIQIALRCKLARTQRTFYFFHQYELRGNFLTQCSHFYDLSPVWMRMWVLNTKDNENRLKQTLHSNGFSPVCVRMWNFKFFGHAKLWAKRTRKRFFTSMCSQM